MKKNMSGLIDYVVRLCNAGNIQILNFSTRFYEGKGFNMTETIRHVKYFAQYLEIGKSISLDLLSKYCKSQGETFVKNDVVSLATFEAFSRYTINSIEQGNGYFKVFNGVKHFFAVYRNKANGFIYGTWLPYDDVNRAHLSVHVVSKKEQDENAALRKRKQLEKLAKELGVSLA